MSTTSNEGQRRRELARLICAHLCLHGSMAGMRMATPLLALHLGHGPLMVGILLALFSLSQVFLAIPFGGYADQHGLRRPMGLAVVAAVAGAALSACWPRFEVMCVSALLMGGASGMASIALQRHVGRMAQSATELKQVFSWLAIGPAVSNFLGPVLAGLLIDFASRLWGGASADLGGFRSAFVMMALLPLLTWYWIRGAMELPAPVRAAGAVAQPVWHLLRNAAMRRLLIVNWLLSSCWDVHTFVVPVLGHERGFSASVIGTILGAFAVAAALIRVVIPWLAKHLHEWVVLTGSMLCTAVLFAAYPFLNSPWSMGLCSVLLGIVLGAVQPMIMSTLHQITPDAQHGQALGLRLMILNLSSVLMPMMFGTVGAVVGVSLVFWTTGALVGGGAGMAWRMRPEPLQSGS